MGRNDGLLTHREAAKALDVTEHHLRHLVRQGYLKPARQGRRVRDSLYRPEEVNALLELRLRRIDLPTVATMALQAQAVSRSIENKLSQICRLLGLENNRLKYDEDSVYNLHVRVNATLTEDLTTMRTGAILEWATVFNSFDEEYLRVLEHFTLDDKPWGVYLELANKLMANRSQEADSNLGFAYACLDTARRNLRNVSYFYALARRGQRVANEFFAKNEIDEEIITQLYPRRIGLS